MGERIRERTSGSLARMTDGSLSLANFRLEKPLLLKIAKQHQRLRIRKSQPLLGRDSLSKIGWSIQ